ncbi:MAG: O-antigen ligase family protein [Bacteroidales bacterium]|nr:O-antigen ligase family protein [Bacteroidales bacterium]
MNKRLSGVITFFKTSPYLTFVAGVGLLFVLFCLFCIYKENFILPVIVVSAFIAVYLSVVHTEKTLFLTAFMAPFSIELTNFLPEDINFSIPCELFLGILTVVLLLQYILENRYPLVISKHKISILLILYLFWIFLTSITSSIPLVSFKFWIVKVVYIVPLYFFFAQILKKDIRKIVPFFLFYATALTIVVFITTYRYAQYKFVHNIIYWIVSPFYNDHTAYGAALAFFVPILAIIPCIKTLSKSVRIYSLVLLAPILFGLYFSFSRAAWLSVIAVAMVAVLVLLKIKLRTFILAIVAVLAIFFAFENEIVNKLNRNTQDSSAGNFTAHLQSISNVTSDDSNVERMNRWQSAFSMFKERPVFGWGPGTYQFNYAAFQSAKYKSGMTTNAGTAGNAHSEFFSVLSESGAIGLLILLSLLTLLASTAIKTYKNADNQELKLFSLMCLLALTSYFFHGLLNNFLDTEKLAIPVFAAMAVITVCHSDYKQQSENQIIQEN